VLFFTESLVCIGGTEQARGGRRKWVDKVCKNILEANPHDRGANYVRIHSITNMGCLDSELALTAKEFEPMKGDYIYNLPASPTSIGSYYRKAR
jgi:hypothetical protein